MEGRARQMRDRRLKRINAVVERQERMTPKGHDDRLILQRRRRGMRIFRARRKVGRFLHLATVFWLIPWRLARALRLS